MTIVDHGVYDIEIHEEMIDGCSFAAGDVEKLAADIRASGVVVFPVVRKSTSEVVVGHIVIAACLHMGREVCRCRLVDGDDPEIDSMRAKYASLSGLDPEETMLRSVKRLMDEEVGGPFGKAHGAKAKAIRRFAAEQGITEEAAKKRFQRASRRLRHKRYMTEDRYAKCPVPDHGAPTDRDFRITLHHVVDRCRHIKSKLTEASRALEANQLDPQTRFPSARYTSLRGSIERAQRMVHGSEPASLCPQCAGKDEGERKRCMPCFGMGYLTNSQVHGLGGK